jgi:hypothetical protein
VSFNEIKIKISLNKIFPDNLLDSTVAWICFIIAVLGGIMLSIIFLPKKNERSASRFYTALYNFFNFKKMLAETLFKILYMITSCWITLFALLLLIFGEGVNLRYRFISFMLIFIVGNILLRLVYEFLLVILVICRNIVEINKKMSNLQMNDSSSSGGVLLENEQPSNLKQEINADSGIQVGVVFCRNCGNQFNSTTSKCPHCGAQR